MDRKHLFISFILVSLLLVSVTVAASMLVPASEKAREKAEADNAPVTEEAEENWVLTTPGLEKKIYVHYAKPRCDNDGICEPEIGENRSCADCKQGNGEEPTTTCYGFLGRGVKWKDLPQDYVIDPDNEDSLTDDFIISAISSSAEEWDSHTGAELFGNYTIDPNSSWDSDAPDGRNELLFGDYPEPGVIAIAITWGYFTGPPKTRRIIEFDVLFDTDFTWGDATLNPSIMDLQNIATHEIGHGLGLDDLYEAACAEETMYGYSDFGETEKRSLATGDITGLHELYGS